MVDEYKQDPSASVDKQPDCDMMKKDEDEEEEEIRLSTPSPSIELLIVPTKGVDEAPETVIDTSNLSEEDIEALRKQDPFLYYSIPSVRNAKLRLQSCAVAGEDQDKENQEPTRTRASCPFGGVETSSSAIVKRRSCISFETYPDLDVLLEDCMGETGVLGDGHGADFDAWFDQLLLLRSGSSNPRSRKSE